MTASPITQIRITGLSRVEANDIEDILEARPETHDGVRLEEQTLPSYRLGEPVTFILLAVATSSAVAALGAFLMKRRAHETIRYQVIVEYADGGRRTETLEFSRKISDQPDPEVIEALASLTGVTAEQITKALGTPT